MQIPRHRRARPRDGFSLIELLLCLAVLTVVLASLSRIIVAENKLSVQTGRDLAIRNALSQTTQLLRNEIGLASNITTSTTGLSATCSSDPVPKLVLVGPGGSWRIAYGIRTATVSELSTEWFGPSLLIRCGKPYSTTAGGIDTTLPESKTVALDRLVTGTGFTATMSSNSDANKNASITLNLLSDSNKTLTSTFQTGISRNQLYGTLENLTATCSSPTYKCNDSTDDIDNYRPTPASGSSLTITGDLSKEVVIHFPLKLAGYTIESPCNTSRCKVTDKASAAAVTVLNASLLVFADKEWRLPSP